MKTNDPIASVPDAHMLTVCRIGHGAACCRYLTCSARGFECQKHSDLRALLDARVAAGQMTSRGDNCDGIKPLPATAPATT